MTILVIAEHGDAQLRASTLNTLGAAAKIAAATGGAIEVLVAGHGCEPAAQAVAQAAGVAKVHLAEAPHLAAQLAEEVAAQALALVAQQRFTHVLLPATAFGKNVAPRIAALSDVAQVSEITAVLSHDTFERPIYAGNAIATVQASDALKVITVRTTSFEPVAAEGGTAVVVPMPLAGAFGRSAHVGSELATSARPDLAAAKVVVTGGRGLGSAENFRLLEPLADRLGAALGASRAAVDAGYAPNDWQVGQTGKVVAPQLYIAVGVSGAIQHLAGMKDSKVIVAINKDADAPIFQVADYGLVGDLFEVVPELTAKL